MIYVKCVDCDVCKKKNTSSCYDCINHYVDLPDLYEEVPEEVIKKRDELELREFKESLKGEKLEIALSDEFKRSFALADNFAARNYFNPGFWGVYCGEDFLMATDTWAIARIKAVVPESLVGKQLIYDREGFFIDEDPSSVYTDGQIQRLLNEAHTNAEVVRTVTKQSLDDLISVGGYSENASIILAKIKGGPVFNSIFLDRALAAIEADEEFQISYEAERNPRTPVLIVGKSIECVILPVIEH